MSNDHIEPWFAVVLALLGLLGLISIWIRDDLRAHSVVLTKSSNDGGLDDEPEQPERDAEYGQPTHDVEEDQRVGRDIHARIVSAGGAP